MSNDYDMMFSKLSLQEGDCLVIKVNTEGLSDYDATEKIRVIANDNFLDYLKTLGHVTFITYSGVDMSILRLEENDKVLVNVDITGMDQEIAKQYVEYIENKLSTNISKDRLVIVPSTKSTTINVLKENNE